MGGASTRDVKGWNEMRGAGMRWAGIRWEWLGEMRWAGIR